MDFYHGTIVGGLTELIPYAKPTSNLKEAYVYLTTSKQLATHYIIDRRRIGSSPMLDIRTDGVLVFQEMFSGALEYIYKGLSCYVYHCVEDFPLNKESNVNTCVTSNTPVPIIDVSFVKDVYDVICGIKKDNLMQKQDSPEACFNKEKWPQYWREAEALYNHDLLYKLFFIFKTKSINPVYMTYHLILTFHVYHFH